MSDFRIELTTLHRPSTPAVLLTKPGDATVDHIEQFSNPRIKEQLNGQTEWSFELSMFDPWVQHITVADTAQAVLDGYTIPDGYVPNGAYTFACRVYYRGQSEPCFWAPCTYAKNFGTGVVLVTGVDMLRAQRHFLRLGDSALTITGDEGLMDEGLVTVDYVGVTEVLDAAENTSDQNDREVPSFGFVVNGMEGAPERTAKLGVERSQGVWEEVLQILDHRVGPDIAIAFTDGLEGYYGVIQVYGKRGSDRTETVRWFYGVEGEADNTSDVQAVPITPTTHAHVVASDQTQIRETAADALESYLRGVYVSWEAADMNSRNKDEDVIREALKSKAEATVDAYATAPEATQIKLRPDAAQTTFWNEHFWVGDTVYFEAVKGFCTSSGNLRIRSVEVSEQGPRGLATTTVEVVPDLTTPDDGEEG